MTESLDIWVAVARWMLSAAAAAALYRLLRGPSLADRVVALDLLLVSSLGLLATAAIEHRLAVLLDVAVVVGIIGFFGTASVARRLEKREQDS